ncbi:MAG: hypothetical protein B7Z78_07640 [Rhodospirillales bacterium 20-60-12]|nr:MAG: hypothetical protein B7Z78_07640 [Rhodospirillales bacterium 20-60-12]
MIRLDASADRDQKLRIRAARHAAAEQKRLHAQLRMALAAGGFVVHYQPVLHLQNSALWGAEALIRLVHRRRGLIAPGQFIPSAARSTLMNEIGGFVLAEACRQAALWPASWSVSVNIEARQLDDGYLPGQIAAALGAAALAPARLIIELNETALPGLSNAALACLRAMAAQGIRLALDDFGAGLPSLTALRDLPFSIVKLDRRLTAGLPDLMPEMILVRSAIEAGHALNLTVIAKHVESGKQAHCLRALGCDAGQGHWFYPALPPAELRSLHRL